MPLSNKSKSALSGGRFFVLSAAPQPVVLPQRKSCPGGDWVPLKGAGLPAKDFTQTLCGFVTGQAQAGALQGNLHQQIAEVAIWRRNFWFSRSVLGGLR
jgi:hypothetical protein